MAERDGGGAGRVYRVQYEVQPDAAGAATCSGAVDVCVPPSASATCGAGAVATPFPTTAC
jgi:hypothetical protein